MGKLVTSKVILIDSILNIGLLIACIMRIANNVLIDPDAMITWFFICGFLGMFTVADIIYWIFQWQKKKGSIVNEIVKYSVYIKIFGIIIVSITSTFVALLR